MSRRFFWCLMLAALGSAVAPAAETIPIGGRILVPGGSPLPEVEVALLPVHDARGQLESAIEGVQPEPVSRTLTHRDGRFVLQAPQAGLWRVRVDVPGFVPAEARLTPLLEALELPPLELRSDAGLTVKVTDAQGAPLADALVLVRADRSRFYGASHWSPPLRSARTGDDGTTTLPRGERETTVVSASADGHVQEQRRGVHGTAARLSLELGVERALSVSSAAGRPVPGALVAMGSRPHPVGVTDDRGRIALRVPSAEARELVLLADHGRRLETSVDGGGSAGAEPRSLILPDALALRGGLLDADSRRAIAGGLVWDLENPLLAAVADRSGGFELRAPAGRRMRLVAGAPGYLQGSPFEYQLVEDGRPGPALALRPAAAVEGRVVDVDGQPVAGAEIEVEKKSQPGMMRIQIGAPVELPRTLSTDRGTFRLGQLDPDNAYKLRVRAEGFASAELDVTGLKPHRTRSGVTVEMSRGRRLVGSVVDADGLPVREATVSVRRTSEQGHGGMIRMMGGGGDVPAIETLSGEDGSFEVAGIPSGRFDIEVLRGGFARRKVVGVELEQGDEPHDLGEIRLQPGETVQGLVVNRNGQPVEGAEIFAKEAAGGGAMMFSLGGPSAEEQADTTTDATGWFAVEDLAPGSRYSFRVHRRGYVEHSVQAVEVPSTEPLRVTLHPASRVVGHVYDDEGDPLVGAEVTMRRSRTMEMGGAAMQMMMMASEDTDGQGRFVFEDQEPGTISLRAVASGFQEAKRDDLEIPEGQDLEGIEIPLESGAVLVGQVLTPDGRPAIEARVSPVSESAGPMRMMGGSPTDAEGRYRIEGLSPGVVSIEATHNDFPRAVKDVELVTGENELDLSFEGGHEVSGRVVDDAGGPVADAVARLAPAGRFFGGPEAGTETDGTFVLRGVQDGDYRIWVDAEGYASTTGEQQVKVSGGPVPDVEVRLSRGATLVGKVSGLEPEQFGQVGVSAEGGTFRGFDRAAVDFEGNYRVENLLPGAYQVVATLADSGRQAKGQVSVDAGATEVQLDLRFGTGLTLSGRALQDEQPVGGAAVYVEGLELDHTAWTQTDHEGEFSVEGLEPGPYRVHLRDWRSGMAYNEQFDLSTSRSVELRIPSASVGGRIVDGVDRQPLAGVTVTLTSADPGSGMPLHTATSDLEGSFRLAHVSDGQWRLSVEKKGYAAVSETVSVQHDRPVADLELRMDPTEGMTLEARLPTGAPPSDVRVAVLDPTGSPIVSGDFSTGENGRVRLSSVPPGTWDLVVSAAGSATSKLRASVPGATVPVALQPACALRVRVPELSESSAVATVRLQDSAGQPYVALTWNGRPRTEWRMAGGRLELAALPPGSWSVSVSSTDGRSWQGSSVTSTEEIAELLLE